MTLHGPRSPDHDTFQFQVLTQVCDQSKLSFRSTSIQTKNLRELILVMINKNFKDNVSSDHCPHHPSSHPLPHKLLQKPAASQLWNCSLCKNSFPRTAKTELSCYSGDPNNSSPTRNRLNLRAKSEAGAALGFGFRAPLSLVCCVHLHGSEPIPKHE